MCRWGRRWARLSSPSDVDVFVVCPVSLPLAFFCSCIMRLYRYPPHFEFLDESVPSKIYIQPSTFTNLIVVLSIHQIHQKTPSQPHKPSNLCKNQ